MKAIFSAVILLASVVCYAAGGEHSGAHGDHIPKVIIYQAINLSILFGLLFYFTRQTIVRLFSSRQSAYLLEAKKSAAAREQAERSLLEIKNRLASLEATRDESLRKARAHADDIVKQISDEAVVVTKRIRDEAELAGRLEVQRAQKELRTQLLAESVEAARMVMTKDLSVSDQQKLQKDFINNIGV